MRTLQYFALLVLLCILAASHETKAQQKVKDFLKKHIDTLCSPSMHGRGYVDEGRLKAAHYIEQMFRYYELRPIEENGSYIQTYTFPVNTFPSAMELSLGGVDLRPGADFIVDAASPSYQARKQDVKYIDLLEVKDKNGWNNLLKAVQDKDYVYYLDNGDSLSKKITQPVRKMVSDLPAGCFIWPQHGKLTWTVATKNIAATVFYVEDTVLPNKIKKATVNVSASIDKAAKSENVIGMVPGNLPDSFVVFTAHHDHLGMMGKDALFPGASDNASGTATLLYLAKYFEEHPMYYTVVFISFSGEEAGLLGSEFFVKHPTIPLDHIKLLVNLDIMGDASNGITVVNATEYPQFFGLLQHVNKEHNYLPEIKSRGKAANSDHYNFSEHGVPSLFMYSNGGKGYYHDVFDKPNTLSLKNVDDFIRLIIDFMGKLG